MKFTKLIATVIALMMLAAVPAMATAENFGSSAVTAGETYTLEQMLTYAMEDEYFAQAEYAVIMAEYGENAPFANVIKAEGTHIALLETLFGTYSLTLPENTAAQQVSLPASLTDAYAAGIAAENANIAMYKAFLSQNALPQDAIDTFTALKNASENHLAAFTQNAGKNGMGMRNNQNETGRGRNNRSANDETSAKGSNAENCPLGEDCLATSSQSSRQTRRNSVIQDD